MYKKEQVFGETLKYFKGDELATNTFVNKYCLKKAIPDSNDFIYFELTPDDMHRRLAKEFARIEKKYMNPLGEEEIYQLLKGFNYIIPQGSPMAGIGNNFAISSISNCLVVGGHPDSYGGIFMLDQEQAQLMKRRCGVGEDLSFLRPSGAMAGASPLGPNAGTTLYMKRFSNTTREVQQDGRRGALMLTIDIKHPDAEKFIDKKMVEGEVTGANVSVKITDEFMDCLEKERPFFQIFPCKYSIEEVQLDYSAKEVNVLHSGRIIEGVQTYFRVVDPKLIWEKIVYNAWRAAEPGILFWDNILNESPARAYGPLWKEEATNPCGEIPLPANDSCRLLLLNLYGYIFQAFTSEAQLEDTLLVDHVKKAMRLMDDIVDLEIEKIDEIIADIESKIHPLVYQEIELALWKKIRQMAVDGRRTGLGITGEADLIAALGIQYGTPEATDFSEMLHQLIATAAYESSIELAEERGAFPICNTFDIDESEFLTRMFYNNVLMTDDLLERYKKFGRRNIAILTIAPAGSVSIESQTSSGLEPVFSPWYFRKTKVDSNAKYDHKDAEGDCWIEYPVFHKPFIDWYSAHYELPFEVAKYDLERFTKEKLNTIFEKSPYYKATAQDVDYVEKVRMQGAVQRWVDHSISVTVNMPENVTEKMVADVYKEAYKSKCKGITVYRDNSRGNVLSTTSIKNVEDIQDFDYLKAYKRPKEVECDIFFKSARNEPFIILVGKIFDKPYEIFVIPYNERTKISKTFTKGIIFKSKKGKYDLIGENSMPLIDDITSYMIENEQNETRSISALLRHRVDPKWIVNSIIEKYATVNSFHKVIGKVLSSYVTDKNVPCPECGEEMVMSEGCMKCPSCGYAHCG